ncbi:uncharacterized protein LOC144094559 [Amblyomma americanum]
MDVFPLSASSGHRGVDPPPAAFRAAQVDSTPASCVPAIAAALPQGASPRTTPPGPRSAVAGLVLPQAAAVLPPADAPRGALVAAPPRPRQPPHRVTFDVASTPVPFLYTPAPMSPPEPNYGYSTVLLSESATFSILGGTLPSSGGSRGFHGLLTDKNQRRPIVKDLVLGLLVLLSMTLMLTAALILVVSAGEKKGDDEENGDMAGTTAPDVTTTGTEAEVATPVALPLHADSDDKLIAHYTMN